MNDIFAQERAAADQLDRPSAHELEVKRLFDRAMSFYAAENTEAAQEATLAYLRAVDASGDIRVALAA